MKRGRTFPSHQGHPSLKDHTFISISRRTGPSRIPALRTHPGGQRMSLVGLPTNNPASWRPRKIQPADRLHGQWRSPFVSCCNHTIPMVFMHDLPGWFRSIRMPTERPQWRLSPHPTINQSSPRQACLFPRQVPTTSVFHPWDLKFILTHPPFTRDRPVPCGSSPGRLGEQQGLWSTSWTWARCNQK